MIRTTTISLSQYKDHNYSMGFRDLSKNLTRMEKAHNRTEFDKAYHEAKRLLEEIYSYRRTLPGVCPPCR